MAKLIYEEEIDDAFDIKNIQRIIVRVRKIRGLTQKQLGALVGVSAAQVCKIEKSYTNVTFSTIQDIFKALEIKAEFKPIELNTTKDDSVNSEEIQQPGDQTRSVEAV